MDEIGCPDTKAENLKLFTYTIKNRGFNTLLKDCSEEDGPCLTETELSEKTMKESVQLRARDFFVEETQQIDVKKIDLTELPQKNLIFKPKSEKPENEYEKILVSIAAKSRHLLYLTLCTTVAETYYNFLKSDTPEEKAKFIKAINLFMLINKNNPYVKTQSPELTLLNPTCFAKNHFEYKFFNSLVNTEEEEELGVSLAECLRGLSFSKHIE
jgi:hypothetical protein